MNYAKEFDLQNFSSMNDSHYTRTGSGVTSETEAHHYSILIKNHKDALLILSAR